MSKKSGRKRKVTAPATPPVDPDDGAQAEYEASMREYRKFLEQCESEATSEFDKTAVTLSGGALGIAMAFLKDVPASTPAWAFTTVFAGAMVALVISLLGVLLSLMASRKSMRYELQCVDGRREKPKGEEAGGWWRSAELSFRTFWTSAREFSPFKDGVFRGRLTAIRDSVLLLVLVRSRAVRSSSGRLEVHERTNPLVGTAVSRRGSGGRVQ